MHVGALVIFDGPPPLRGGSPGPPRGGGPPGAALPQKAPLPAARRRPPVLGGRPDVQPRLPRAPHRAPEAGHGLPAPRAARPDLLPAARPVEAALGGLDRPRPP